MDNATHGAGLGNPGQSLGLKPPRAGNTDGRQLSQTLRHTQLYHATYQTHLSAQSQHLALTFLSSPLRSALARLVHWLHPALGTTVQCLASSLPVPRLILSSLHRASPECPHSTSTLSSLKLTTLPSLYTVTLCPRSTKPRLALPPTYLATLPYLYLSTLPLPHSSPLSPPHSSTAISPASLQHL